MTFVVLNILLVASVVAVVWVSVAVYQRVRKAMADKQKPTDTGLFPPRGNDADKNEEI
jgi:hypothetical protein